MLKVLHTSDWHIGRTLYSKRRYEEFAAFLDWLLQLIAEQGIDILLISGDVFDTTTPSNKALELYYSFLSVASNSCCRKIVVIGGNHDSATSLDAPKDLLKALNISVVGAARESLAEEVITVSDRNGELELVVCAVPFLRERDLRRVEAGESIAEKESKLLEGLREHYNGVVKIAKDLATEKVPVLVMGHLYTASAFSSGKDSERELYVGTLAHVDVSDLPSEAAYYALGHLHRKQLVGGSETIRYSGSPIPMSFSEATQQKVVLCLEFNDDSKLNITELPVPVFQRLESVSGDLDVILTRINELKSKNESVWIEVEYTGSAICAELKDEVEAAVAGSCVEVCRIRNNLSLELSLMQNSGTGIVELGELDKMLVFRLCLQERDIVSEQAVELEELYTEILQEMQDEDGRE